MEAFESKKSQRHVTVQQIEEQLIREQELTWTSAAPWVSAILLVIIMSLPMFRIWILSLLAMLAGPAVIVGIIVTVLVLKERAGWMLRKAQAARNTGGNDVR
ncbi:MAG: hypothetical protein A4E60_01948 [Syntrophorhabdus sp. PtaB.Bin047]|nr:MAG: hypothetical protein A4E60_01948 [Syntrophorhabdus sp. PtaB.Bin047]